MTTYVALLRAVNLAGHGMVPMASLRDLAAGLGFRNPRTLLQSGNLVFEASAATPARLESTLEAELVTRVGVATDVMVRTKGGWGGIVARNPFPDEARDDPSHLLVMVLKRAPAAAALASLEAAIRGPELVRSVGSQVYLVYPDGIGRSKLTTALIERHLGTRGTARNWNTVLKLASACEERT